MMPRTKRANGEGTVYRRPDGAWSGQLSYLDPDTGKRRRATFYGKTAREVRQKIKAAQDRVSAGAPPKDARATLAAYTERWIATTLAASGRKATTRATYAALARRHLIAEPFGSVTLDRLKPSDVEALVLTMRAAGKSSSTIRQTYTVLRAVLDAAVRDGLVARNAAAAVKRPGVERIEAHYLSPDDVRRLLAAAERSRHHALLVLLAKTGLRRGEALALRWDDVDLSTGRLRVRGTLARIDGALTVTEPKTERSRRVVPLPRPLVELLRAHRIRQAEERLRAGSLWHEDGFVFTTETGRPVDPRNALRALYGAARDARLDGARLHTLRHSAASTMLAAGVPLRAVSDVLGHSSVAITGDVYGHVSPDLARDALDRLSDALGG